MLSKETRKELMLCKKTLIGFQKTSRKVKWATLTLNYKLGNVPRLTFCFSFVAVILYPLKLHVVWASYLVKANFGAGAVAVGTGVGVTATAASIVISSSVSTKPIHANLPEKQKIIAESTLPTITKSNPPQVQKQEPIFKPRLATVVKINTDEISGLILDFNSSYIIIEVDNQKLIIPQQDIYKILW